MDDSTCREFFSQTANPYQRRYEALRAVFVDGRSHKDIAEEFGYQYSSLRHPTRLREAALDHDSPPIPWLNNQHIEFAYL